MSKTTKIKQYDFDNMKFHPLSEMIVKILCQKIGNYNPEFFRVLTTYHLAKMAAMMRASVFQKGKGYLPVNIYALNLAPSGSGKNYSGTIFTEFLYDKFKAIYEEVTLPALEEEYLAKLVIKRAAIDEIEEDDAKDLVKADYEKTGPHVFQYNSGTVEGTKQYRHKLKMVPIGSLNYEIDEIAKNMTNAETMWTLFLELYDKGLTEEKLIKHSKDNPRANPLKGATPANLLAFGEPNQLLNGGNNEQSLFSFFETGMARRMIFGYVTEVHNILDVPAEELYRLQSDPDVEKKIKKISAKFGQLASISNHNKVITIPEKVGIELIEYYRNCIDRRNQLGENENLARLDLEHRHTKVVKLAGCYAFIDGESEVTMDNLFAAIKMVEESGKSFYRLLNREGRYAKLAKFIAGAKRELYPVDLTEHIPHIYKGKVQEKKELMDLAVGWGYKHGIVIKRSFTSNGIEVFSGETLEKTDLNKLRLSWSKDIAKGYTSVDVPFEQFYKLAQKNNLHWVNHKLKNQHRHGDNIIPGFNMVVIDVDGGTQLTIARKLLQDYLSFFYTTRRHTQADNRFRIILPIKYILKLDADEYKEFMMNIFSWLPFDVDEAAKDRPRKWLTNKGQYCYNNDGEILDPLQFMPKTFKNDERKRLLMDTQSMSNLERWFIQHTADGNRNNQIIKYALLRVDMGESFGDVRTAVLALNDKLQDKMTVREIDTTIMQTVSKRTKQTKN